MKRMQTILKVFLRLLVLICMVSCQAEFQGEPDRLITPAPEQNDQVDVEDQNEMQRTEDERRRLELEGGAEITTREPNPVSNNLLQREYPNILALRGSLNDDRVALTFDDGPDSRYTPLILDVLKEYNVKATFFVMGSRAVALPDLIQRIHDEGHAIGNHTYWHPDLDKDGVGKLQWEITETEKVLEEIVGYTPALFRAPYGALNEELVEKLGEMDYSVIGWSVDSSDWMQLSSEQIEKNVLSNAHPGAIILMHDGGHWTMDMLGTVDSLRNIIQKLQEDGIEFVTVPELLNIRAQK